MAMGRRELEAQGDLWIVASELPRGDTTSLGETIDQADAYLVAVMQNEKACEQLGEQVLTEVVADKGYHSHEVLEEQRERDIRTYISEPDRGRRNWRGQTEQQTAEKLEARDAVYGNCRRIKGERGKSLMRKRGELVERSFAHCYDTGGMRRTHLKGHNNILKRLLIHVAGFNLSPILRKMLGFGTARGLQNAAGRAWRAFAGHVTYQPVVELGTAP